jgi:parvulin-like peptidyl-prolyl isomerase
MKTRQFVVTLGLIASLGAASFGQDTATGPEAAAEEDPIVVAVYGKQFTRSDVESLRRHVPTQFRANTQNMTNQAFLESFGFLQAMALLAEQDGFLDREPYKTQAEFNEINFLAQAYLQMLGASVQVSDEDKQAFYEQNIQQFQEVRVSAIYLNFTPVPELAERQGRPVVLEADARAKADGLHEQLEAGADFAELASENSDDEASAAKGGDLGYFRPEDPLSEAVKAVVFRMEVGQTSEPVRDSGRFYIFRVTDKRPRPFEDVEGSIDTVISRNKLNERLADIRRDIRIFPKDEEWLNSVPGRN